MSDQQKYLPSWALAPTVLAALFLGVSPGTASPILGSDLASFAVLGASTVTNTGATTLTGNLGVYAGSAITGQSTITINGDPALTTGSVFVHTTDAVAQNAQSQLTIAMTDLSLLGPGTTLINPDLTGLVLAPGVYTVKAGVSNLTGTVTLDGQGNANAAWVFEMESTLITSPDSVVSVINTGAGAGIYWDVASSATIDLRTAFEGNILALDSITLNTNATIGCGRALASTGAVTMDTNTIGTGCSAETGGEGSNGFSGGLSVTQNTTAETPTFLEASSVTVPEPSSFILFLTGFVGLAFAARRGIAVTQSQPRHYS